MIWRKLRLTAAFYQISSTPFWYGSFLLRSRIFYTELWVRVILQFCRKTSKIIFFYVLYKTHLQRNKDKSLRLNGKFRLIEIEIEIKIKILNI